LGPAPPPPILTLVHLPDGGNLFRWRRSCKFGRRCGGCRPVHERGLRQSQGLFVFCRVFCR